MNNILLTMLKDKVILITGASRGLGAELARVHARHGAHVFINYINSKEKAEALVNELKGEGFRAEALQADVTAEEAVKQMMQHISKTAGRLDVLINNALPKYQFDATANYTSLETVKWEDFETQHEGAVKAAFLTGKYALPMMKAQQYGKIVNISTNLLYNPVVPYYDYTTAKAGLLGLTRLMATELGQYGVRVNLLAGGLLETTDASSTTSPEIFAAIAQNTPLRKTTTVEDFAKATVYFSSAMSDAITGQSISIDGGLTMP